MRLRTLLKSEIETSVAIATYGLLSAFLLIRILRVTQYHFTYTLDDPYIHLALAERIRAGFYGLNMGEACSPSSSILWPFLLAPFATTRFAFAVPLILNLIAGITAAVLVGKILKRAMHDLYVPASSRGVLGLLVVLALNLVGLTFTGMEQLTEVLLCLACAVLLLDLLRGFRERWWTIAAATILPAVRYEGILVMAACVACLWLYGKQRLATLTLACSMVPVVGFSIWLKAKGLPGLPISVLMKGASLGTTPGAHLLHFFAAAQQNMGAISYAPERWPVMLLAIASGALALHVGTNRQARWLFAILCFVATTQFLFGPFGWFWRYELYCIALVLPLVLVGWLMRSHEVGAPLLFAISLPALIYLQPLTATPNAARSIYREQGAIAQLTHNNYDGRIAVIDLGLQAFRRPPDRYILDLAALGSPDVFQSFRSGSYPSSIPGLVNKHGIGLVIAPQENIGDTPAGWSVRGQLCAEGVQYGPSSAAVLLYSTAKEHDAEVDAALVRLRQSLRLGTQLFLHPREPYFGCTKTRPKEDS